MKQKFLKGKLTDNFPFNGQNRKYGLKIMLLRTSAQTKNLLERDLLNQDQKKTQGP